MLLGPILQYFDMVKQLIFLLINRHSGLQIPLAFPGIGGKMQEDPENETHTLIHQQLPKKMKANLNCLQPERKGLFILLEAGYIKKLQILKF